MDGLVEVYIGDCPSGEQSSTGGHTHYIEKPHGKNVFLFKNIWLPKHFYDK